MRPSEASIYVFWSETRVFIRQLEIYQKEFQIRPRLFTALPCNKKRMHYSNCSSS